MSEVTGISRTSIQRILKHYKWHPYKIQLLHELNEDDHDRRLQFCEIMRHLQKQFEIENSGVQITAVVLGAIEVLHVLVMLQEPFQSSLQKETQLQRRAIRLIGDSALTCRLQPLSHRRAVADLSLFYRDEHNGRVLTLKNESVAGLKENSGKI
nr:unnamed protein product [Callosobruchus chinensis]